MPLAKPRWLQSFENFKQGVVPTDDSSGMVYGTQEELNPVANIPPPVPQENPFFSEDYMPPAPMIQDPMMQDPMMQDPMAAPVAPPTDLPPNPYFPEGEDPMAVPGGY